MTTMSPVAATGPHVLPPLPYAEGALAPFISARTMALHRGQHHQGYVDALNKAIAGTPYADLSLQQTVIATAKQTEHVAIFNNAAQVWNHNFYWQSLRPQGGGDPPPTIRSLIVTCFGGVADCKDALVAAAARRFGSGWVWLVLEAGQLKVLDTGNADGPNSTSQRPLLAIDVWEHAYYLDYQNRRAEHVRALINGLINWGFAADNLHY
ncbi:MAG TPA: superoxide dismutase [Burkholderiaceae bacterium]|nr:superoxide dismutase [Burkholderiaceae bacterium]